MKRLLLLLMIVPVITPAQIKIDDVGDGWKKKVDSAISLISATSDQADMLVRATTGRIEFWLGDRSSVSYPRDSTKGTILLAVGELKLGIENIAAVIVHESFHLHIAKIRHKMKSREEEIAAYAWELVFLKQIPNCPNWLILNAEYQIDALSQTK